MICPKGSSAFQAMANKAMTTKFEVEKSNGKGNFSLCQRRVQTLLAMEGLLKALLSKAKKPDGMNDADWEDMDVKAAGTTK